MLFGIALVFDIHIFILTAERLLPPTIEEVRTILAGTISYSEAFPNRLGVNSRNFEPII